MFGQRKVKDLSPEAVRAELAERRILLVDVREPAEFAVERIHGAVNAPLSTFDPQALPEAEDRLIVFSCGSGKRSAMAVERCLKAGRHIESHLAGGLIAWKAAGLPTTSVDPDSGRVRDRV